LQGGYTLPDGAFGHRCPLSIKRCWVASDNVLRHWSPELSLLATIPIGGAWSEAVASIALDSLADHIWIIGQGSIARLASNDAMREAVIARIDGAVRGSALDPKTGMLWLLTGDEVRAYDRSLRQVLSISLSAIDADGASSPELRRSK
jgi:hypothetical protein